MKISQTVSITEDVTLITLSDSPADIHFISSIFDCIAEAKISVDMIAQSAPIGDRTSLWFLLCASAILPCVPASAAAT